MKSSFKNLLKMLQSGFWLDAVIGAGFLLVGLFIVLETVVAIAVLLVGAALRRIHRKMKKQIKNTEIKNSWDSISVESHAYMRPQPLVNMDLNLVKQEQ